jgi:predicted AAA+ superfamily ATPase
LAYKRTLKLPQDKSESFFLWGPRQSGKSTLLKLLYPEAVWIDLLKSEEFRRYLSNPEILRQELLTLPQSKRLVVIDEVQKVPQILNEVHWLIENAGARFALCGSSARKVKRGHANLLGGRAMRFELSGLTAKELGEDFDLTRILNHGYLPKIYSSDRPARLLRTYVADYLKEEIAAEGLVRNLPAFSSFLEAASFSDCEQVNLSAIAREVGKSVPTVNEYFQILEDTLLGKWLPAYRKRPKRRIIESSKFYFFDIGIVNTLQKRGTLAPGSSHFGKAFENWVFHELSAYREYLQDDLELSYWKLSSGAEVDFVVNNLEFAIEAKASSKITDDHLRGLRELAKDQPNVKHRIVVSLEPKTRVTSDGIKILPVDAFIERLWDGMRF